MKIKLIAPCHFGMESVLKREIYDIGYDPKVLSDGRVSFEGDEEAVCRSNILLRTAERIMVEVGSFHAETFEELFQETKAIPWEEYLPADAKFWVAKAASVDSKLFSPSDIQSIMKKAMVERLKTKYGKEWFEEDGAAYPVRVFIRKDEVTVAIDTSGESLHKRGYRKMTAKAPIAENLAAGLIMLTPWKKDRILVDPFCGSGTIPIEAALMAAGIAPGLYRNFTAEGWTNIIDKKLWTECAEEARADINMDIKTDIQGYDIDDKVLEAARANARLAGVENLIHFQKRDVADLSHSGKYGFVITNPPYGERISDKEEAGKLYKILGDRVSALDSWSLYMITSYEGAEKAVGKKAEKNRKIYNGMMKTYFYQFPGPKPAPRKHE